MKHQSNLWHLIKVNNKGIRKMWFMSFWCFYSSLWTNFTRYSSASVIEFESVHAGCEVFDASVFCSVFELPTSLELYSGPCQTSIIEHFSKVVNYFRKMFPSQLLNWVLNTSLQISIFIANTRKYRTEKHNICICFTEGVSRYY